MDYSTVCGAFQDKHAISLLAESDGSLLLKSVMIIVDNFLYSVFNRAKEHVSYVYSEIRYVKRQHKLHHTFENFVSECVIPSTYK